MGKAGTFLLILFLLWLVAPTQTEHMISSVVTSISARLDASSKASANR